MSLATLSTQALAVRKHGGGLAPIQRPTQQAGGHPLRSKGGEINSICCVAAGIINLLLRAAASHAYPTTCVRRAPFTAAPLRSQNRPHAQLVVGYKHNSVSNPISWFEASIQGKADMLTLNNEATCGYAGSMLLQFFKAAITRARASKLLNLNNRFRQLANNYEHGTNGRGGKWLHDQRPHNFNRNIKTSRLDARAPANRIGMPVINLLTDIKQSTPRLINGRFDKLCRPGIALKNGQTGLLSFSFMRQIGDKKNSHDGSYRTKCLHPSSTRLTCTHRQYKDVGRGKQDDSTGHCRMPLNKAPYLITPHAAPIPGLKGKSLPSFCDDVHGGFA